MLRGFKTTPEEDINKAKQLCNEQELCAQEALKFCNSFLENMDKTSQVKSETNTIEIFSSLTNFGITNIQNYQNLKAREVPQGSSKHNSSSSASWKASVKSKENLLKLRQDTTKTKLFVEHAEEQAKRKLDLIRRDRS